MQPAYLPWIGYFHRIDLCDVLILLDHVQIDRNSKTGFAHRNRVRTREGWTWLTVPLKTKGRRGQLQLDQLEIADQTFRRKHWGTIRQSYASAPFYATYASTLESIFDRQWERLVPLANELLRLQLDAMGIEIRIQRSSDMLVHGKKTELIVNLCRAVGARVYLSGPFGREYLDPRPFADAQIPVAFHEYAHPVYRQYQGGFEPYMAAIDLLMNAGPESAIIMRQGNADRTAITNAAASEW